MYEDLGIPIAVVAVFNSNGMVVPYRFKWQGRTYQVESVNLRHQQKQGSATLFLFSVSTKANVYELSFNNNFLSWKLERIWHD